MEGTRHAPASPPFYKHHGVVCPGFKDGQPLDEQAAALVEDIVVHGLFFDQAKVPVEQRVDLVKQSFDARAQREKAYLVL